MNWLAIYLFVTVVALFCICRDNREDFDATHLLAWIAVSLFWPAIVGFIVLCYILELFLRLLQRLRGRS